MKFPMRSRLKGAFTLVEMVGVLAIISILATLLMPRIFSAINESRINNAVASCNTVRSAAITYFGKYGRFGGLGGVLETNTVVTNWDSEVMMPEGLLERSFGPRLGDVAYIQLADGLSRDTDPTEANAAYNLDNKPSFNKNDAYGHKVVEAIFKNISKEDAWEMSWRVDGLEGTLTNKLANEDFVGRVKYKITGSIGDVRVYLAHK